MKRPPRMMKRNHGTEAPTNLIFLDTEAYRNVHRKGSADETQTLRIWCSSRIRLERGIATRRARMSGLNASDFWSFLERYSDPFRATWVFAHGIGYDLQILGFTKKLDDGHFTLKPMFRKDKEGNETDVPSWAGKFIAEGTCTIIKCRTKDKRYMFVDTLNYWPCKLEEMGESIGVEKMEMPDQKAPVADWLRYCWRDVDIVERSVTTLIQNWTKENCGVFQATAASLAFTNWRHTCKVRDPSGSCVDVVCEPDSPKHDMERAAYFGGRIQAFKLGRIHGPVWHVDINSLYPYAMRNHSFPRRYIRDDCQVSPAALEAAANVYGIVGEVRIRSDTTTYPLRIDGIQHHCRGDFWTTLCGPELQRALRMGAVRQVGRVQYYSLAPLFREWVDYWYKRKSVADRRGANGLADRGFAKLILLSLSGKFAQHGRRWEDVHDYYALERWGGWPQQLGGRNCPIRRVARPETVEDSGPEITEPTWVNCRGIAGHTQVLLTDREPDHAFPAISAFITSHAREYVRGIIAEMPYRSVYYLAVDGMLVSDLGYHWLRENGWIDPHSLGYFKVKGPYNEVVIHGSNDYELDGKPIVAGWKGKATAKGKKGKVCAVFERLSHSITKGPCESVTVRELPVSDYVGHNKGRYDNNGEWHPFNLRLSEAYSNRADARGYLMENLLRLNAVDNR